MRPAKRKSDSRSSGAGPDSAAFAKSASNRLTNHSSGCKFLRVHHQLDSSKESPVQSSQQVPKGGPLSTGAQLAPQN
jgi:hypothetical protein